MKLNYLCLKKNAQPCNTALGIVSTLSERHSWYCRSRVFCIVPPTYAKVALSECGSNGPDPGCILVLFWKRASIVAPTHSVLCITFDQVNSATRCILSFIFVKRCQQHRYVPKNETSNWLEICSLWFIWPHKTKYWIYSVGFNHLLLKPLMCEGHHLRGIW